MSDTPRTDAVCRTVDHTAIMGGKIYQATIETVDASFARQLEKELAEARAEIERLNKKCADEFALRDIVTSALERTKAKQQELIEQMRDALNILVASATPSGPLWHGSAEMKIARAALSAAERGGK